MTVPEATAAMVIGRLPFQADEWTLMQTCYVGVDHDGINEDHAEL